MKYGFYEKSEDDEGKESKLSIYSGYKENDKHKISLTEQKLSRRQNSTKGISFGSIKSAGEEAAKETSKEGIKNAASKAPSAAVQVIDAAKEGMQKVLDYVKPEERPSDEENTEGSVKGILCAGCVVLCFFIIIAFLFLPMVLFPSVITFLIGGTMESETTQVPHTWEPYERNLECADCAGTGFELCSDCSGMSYVFCGTCGGYGYTFTTEDDGAYDTYTAAGCLKCGGRNKSLSIGSFEYESEAHSYMAGKSYTWTGTGKVSCTACGGDGVLNSKCMSCNGQGVYYHCINEGCPYHEWNHWESLGVDLDGICYETGGEVAEND